MAGSADHSMVDAGPVVNTDIEHISANSGIEKNEYNKLKHELRQDFVG